MACALALKHITPSPFDFVLSHQLMNAHAVATGLYFDGEEKAIDAQPNIGQTFFGVPGPMNAFRGVPHPYVVDAIGCAPRLHVGDADYVTRYLVG